LNAAPIRRQQGFVLILTLCILAAITIVAAYFGQRIQQSLQLAQLRQVLTEKQIAINNSRSEILFRLCATNLTAYGLGPPGNEIVLDDRPYSNEGTTIQLQDTRGLININLASDGQLQGFLGAMHVPADQRSHLIDTLRDYIDADDFRRLEGAESAEYTALGLPPPRNMALFSPLELKSIIGWRDMPSLWQYPAITELVTVSGLPTINPNSAPWQVLASLPGVTPEIAKLIVARRKLGPISVALLDQIAGVNLDTFPPTLIAYPSDHLRITQRAIGMPWAVRYNVELTPLSNVAPWQVNYYYRVEEKADPANANTVVNGSEIPKLPPRSIFTATQKITPLL
jgi:general secretion pathway protein K